VACLSHNFHKILQFWQNFRKMIILTEKILTAYSKINGFYLIQVKRASLEAIKDSSFLGHDLERHQGWLTCNFIRWKEVKSTLKPEPFDIHLAKIIIENRFEERKCIHLFNLCQFIPIQHFIFKLNFSYSIFSVSFRFGKKKKREKERKHVCSI